MPWNASFVLKFSFLWDYIQCLLLLGEHNFYHRRRSGRVGQLISLLMCQMFKKKVKRQRERSEKWNGGLPKPVNVIVIQPLLRLTRMNGWDQPSSPSNYPPHVLLSEPWDRLSSSKTFTPFTLNWHKNLFDGNGYVILQFASLEKWFAFSILNIKKKHFLLNCITTLHTNKYVLLFKFWQSILIIFMSWFLHFCKLSCNNRSVTNKEQRRIKYKSVAGGELMQKSASFGEITVDGIE